MNADPAVETPLAILRRRQDDHAKDLGRDDEGWCFPRINVKGVVGSVAELRQLGKDDQRFPVEDVHSLRRTWESIVNARAPRQRARCRTTRGVLAVSGPDGVALPHLTFAVSGRSQKALLEIPRATLVR